MAKAKGNYISVELDFAEEQIRTWKEYVLNNPINSLKDRIEWKSTKTGGSIPMVVASIEQQGKFLQDTMKNYLALLAEVDRLREKEDQKQIQSRGDKGLSPFETGDI